MPWAYFHPSRREVCNIGRNSGRIRIGNHTYLVPCSSLKTLRGHQPGGHRHHGNFWSITRPYRGTVSIYKLNEVREWHRGHYRGRRNEKFWGKGEVPDGGESPQPGAESWKQFHSVIMRVISPTSHTTLTESHDWTLRSECAQKPTGSSTNPEKINNFISHQCPKPI